MSDDDMKVPVRELYKLGLKAREKGVEAIRFHDRYDREIKVDA